MDEEIEALKRTIQGLETEVEIWRNADKNRINWVAQLFKSNEQLIAENNQLKQELERLKKPKKSWFEKLRWF